MMIIIVTIVIAIYFLGNILLLRFINTGQMRQGKTKEEHKDMKFIQQIIFSASSIFRIFASSKLSYLTNYQSENSRRLTSEFLHKTMPNS